jgi:hypothetical protein
MNDFYKWWTEKIKGNYITDEQFDNIINNNYEQWMDKNS